MLDHGFRKYEIIKLLNDIKKTIKRVEQNVPIQIDNAINQLLDGAPEALDTLKELADALGNDGNFATYITNQITELNNKIGNAKPLIIRATQQSSLVGDITLTDPTSGLEAYTKIIDALNNGRDVILAITQISSGRERLYRAWAWKSSNQQNVNFQADISGSKISFTINANGNITNDSTAGLYEITTRKVTSLSSQSTDEQYPSAKCVYDIIGDVESALNALL